MPFTTEEKNICSEIYLAFTGEEIEPGYWNEAAADYLAEFVYEVIKCSRGMGMARSLFPSTIKITGFWLVKIPYHIIKNEILINNGYVNVWCLNSKSAEYKTAIKAAIITGK